MIAFEGFPEIDFWTSKAPRAVHLIVKLAWTNVFGKSASVSEIFMIAEKSWELDKIYEMVLWRDGSALIDTEMMRRKRLKQGD